MSATVSQTRRFETRLECRYLLQTPSQPSARCLIILAAHGYASNPEDMLRLTTLALGGEHIIASLQGPNQHYLDRAIPASQPGAAYNWGIRQHWEESVRLHHYMVQGALDSLQQEFRVPNERLVLLGFSQPVGLNYRFAGTYPQRIGGIIGLCGGVPRDWEEDKYSFVTAPIVHISREEDEFYPKDTALQFPDRLRKHASEVEFHMLPGAHRFPSQAKPLLRDWIARHWGAAR